MLQFTTLAKKFLIDSSIKDKIERLQQEVDSDTKPTNVIGSSLNCINLPRDLVVSPNINPNKLVLLTPDVVSDIELIKDYNGNSTNTVIAQLWKYCKTEGGRKLIEDIIGLPITDPIVIENRQEIIQYIKSRLTKTHHDALDIIKKNELDVHWLYESHDENLRDLYDTVYFRLFLLNKLNCNSKALTTINLYKMFMSPAIGILSPIIYFIIPFMIIRFKFKVAVPFKWYIKLIFTSMFNGCMLSTIFGGVLGGGTGPGILTKGVKWVSFMFSLLFYFQGMLNSIEVSRTIYKISKLLVEKANKVIEALRAANTIITDLWDARVESALDISFDNDNIGAATDYIQSILSKDYKPFKVYNNFGESLKLLKNVNLSAIAWWMKRAYIIDAITGISSFVTSSPNVSFVCFDKTSQTPVIDLKNTWHICLDTDKVVPNSISLKGKNMILTGPNAGGKSTFIKNLVINVILSQTFGISTSLECTMTPFNVVHTQINIPDCKGKESLFEAEMYRCKNTLELLKNTPGRKLIVMDEIFNSTNPVEGIAGAYAVAKNISSFDSALLVFTTHFVYLTKLSKTKRFTNYRMNVIADENTGEITFPYVLENGISRQYVALELLRKSGFDEDIINEALNVKAHLVTKTVPPRSAGNFKNDQ